VTKNKGGFLPRPLWVNCWPTTTLLRNGPCLFLIGPSFSNNLSSISKVVLILSSLSHFHITLKTPQHGTLPLYTPLGGSWLNVAESMQHLFKRRALDGQYPPSPQHIFDALEAVAAHWNSQSTPFIWAGKRKAQRDRAALKRHRLSTLGAATVRPSRRRFYPSLR
jgi:hypothetical protein